MHTTLVAGGKHGISNRIGKIMRLTEEAADNATAACWASAESCCC